MNRDYVSIELSKNHNNNVADRILAIDPYIIDVDLQADIPGGDMPGDSVDINESTINNAKNLFTSVKEEIAGNIRNNPYGRTIISVAGGSGSGKTSLSAMLAYFLNTSGIGAYTISGDNYPHMIPVENDASRLRVFRHNGVRAVVDARLGSPEVFQEIKKFQERENETGHVEPVDKPWYQVYIAGGKAALNRHLGTPHEQNYNEINDVLNAFRDGAETIWLRRMGRDNTAFWYEEKNFANVSVLILEWTHGLSQFLTGIDTPIFLNTTPEETYADRKRRGRDGNTDTDLIKAVVEIEQRQLINEVSRARIIVSRSGHVITFDDLKNQMDKKGV